MERRHRRGVMRSRDKVQGIDFLGINDDYQKERTVLCCAVSSGNIRGPCHYYYYYYCYFYQVVVALKLQPDCMLGIDGMCTRDEEQSRKIG